MLERDGYPQGVPCWVDIAEPDPQAAVDFYGGLFGWEFEDRMPADAPGNYFVATIRNKDVAAISSQFEGSPPQPFWNTYVWVESADAAAAKAKEAGGSVLAEPFDVMEAGRMAVLADRQGAPISVWQAGRHRGAQLVNEPGTWNFSGLATDDLEAAREFYAEVFGWQAEPLDLGEGAGSMWRLPGYGDYLEQRDPGLRTRMAGQGAPPGFEDVVAWLTPLNGDSADVPPHWSVTFAVDDADATAAKATELGGTVLAPPMDAPYVRFTVLRDSQGAVFTASKYVPPGSE
jgi:predicted enzyme related to lactoylglutathione lyase